MNIKIITDFLSQITVNNNREWFNSHKKEYSAARAEFDTAVEQLIHAISLFDPSVAHLTVKDCTYRFNRDTRFSPDKSPYKRHFGAYISAKGKKSFHGGYYLHIQPDNCFVAVGAYCLPTNILRSCRNEIMANESEWIKAVENGQFIKAFGHVATPHTDGDNSAYDEPGQMSPKGFGLSYLKNTPKDFPKDYKYSDYLRMKDYCCWHRLEAPHFQSPTWITEVSQLFKTAKPMMDFMNGVIDDYE